MLCSVSGYAALHMSQQSFTSFDDSSNISAPSEYPRSETHDPALTYEAPFHSVAQLTESG